MQINQTIVMNYEELQPNYTTKPNKYAYIFFYENNDYE